MSINTAGGVAVFIGTAAAAETLTEFQADTYIEVGEVEDAGNFGDSSGEVSFTALRNARTRHLKGARDAGTMTVQVGDDMLDTGQIAMEAAEGSPLDFNFKVVLNDQVTLNGKPSEHYFRGKVMSKGRNVGTVTNVVRRTFNVGINSEILATDPS